MQRLTDFLRVEFLSETVNPLTQGRLVTVHIAAINGAKLELPSDGGIFNQQQSTQLMLCIPSDRRRLEFIIDR
jgi:hypothetical protein